MQFLLRAAEKDLRRHARDPMSLVLWVGIPLLIGGLISLVMSGLDEAPPTAHLLVADEDGGRLSWLLARAFGQTGSGQFLHVEEVSSEEGRARIGRGAATALLVIPAGFTAAVLKEKPTTLLLVTNPAQRILPLMVQESLEMAADGAFYVHRIAGPEVREIAQGPLDKKKVYSNADIARISVSINKVMERTQKYLFPPVINVEAKSLDQEAGQPKPSITQLFLPGILFMALVFMSEGLSSDVWRERDQGTLRRAACTPAATGALLSGKLLAGAALMLGSSFVVLLAGMIYLGLPLITLPLLLCWSVCSGLTFLLMLQLIQMYASSQRAASVLTNSIAMPLLFVGGSFFPFEFMPAWMAAIGRFTPNGWALAKLKDILAGRETVATLALAFAAIAVIGAVLFFLNLRRLRGVFARS